MTGRELIIYILQNNLEDEEVITNGKIPSLITVEEVAAKFDVGYFTVMAWYMQNMIPTIQIGGKLFFMHDVEDPRKARDNHE